LYNSTMTEWHWDEKFEWQDEPVPEQEEFVVSEARRPSRWNKIARLGALAAVAVGVGTYAGVELTKPGPSRTQRLEKQFHAGSYDGEAKAGFEYLTGLTPEQVTTAVIGNRKKFGMKLQDSAVRVSLAAFRQGLDNKGMKVDMWDVTTQLIPDETQRELNKDGVEFIGENPVTCDAAAPNGDHGYDPLDYTNHPPSDFKVTTGIADGREVTSVPLGTEEMPLAADPLYFPSSFYGWPEYSDRIVLPCVDGYPHQVYGPNQASYPNDSDFVVKLW
jgi:hypothetical protein